VGELPSSHRIKSAPAKPLRIPGIGSSFAFHRGSIRTSSNTLSARRPCVQWEWRRQGAAPVSDSRSNWVCSSTVR